MGIRSRKIGLNPLNQVYVFNLRWGTDGAMLLRMVVLIP